MSYIALFQLCDGRKRAFYGQCIFGTNNELRGYVAGQYIDSNMIATQFEYRHTLPWRFGMVAFVGVGEVAPGLGEMQGDNLLPAGGGGLRFTISRKYKLNFRFNFAQGKDGHTFSMGIGEAFLTSDRVVSLSLQLTGVWRVRVIAECQLVFLSGFGSVFLGPSPS